MGASSFSLEMGSDDGLGVSGPFSFIETAESFSARSFSTGAGSWAAISSGSGSGSGSGFGSGSGSGSGSGLAMDSGNLDLGCVAGMDWFSASTSAKI